MSDSGPTEIAYHSPRLLARRDLLRGVAAAGAAAATIVSTTSTAQAEEEGEYQCRAVARAPEIALNVDFDKFMEISRVLTGMPLNTSEDLRIGKEYLGRSVHLAEMADKNALPNLLSAYEALVHSQPNNPQGIASALLKDDGARPAAEQLIYLWYLSAFYVVPQPDPKAPPAPPGQPPKPPSAAWVYGTPAQYEHALLWKVVDAHPPMLRGGRPGYWAERPIL